MSEQEVNKEAVLGEAVKEVSGLYIGDYVAKTAKTQSPKDRDRE